MFFDVCLKEMQEVATGGEARPRQQGEVYRTSNLTAGVYFYASLFSTTFCIVSHSPSRHSIVLT